MTTYLVRVNGREIITEDATEAEKWSRNGYHVRTVAQ